MEIFPLYELFLAPDKCHLSTIIKFYIVCSFHLPYLDGKNFNITRKYSLN